MLPTIKWLAHEACTAASLALFIFTLLLWCAIIGAIMSS